MSDRLSQASNRLRQVKDLVLGKAQAPASIPWDPECTSFPLRKDLPLQPGGPADACWTWGLDDFRGRLNLLTPTRVRAAAAEIKTGETARLDLPLNVPAQPSFNRPVFKHEIKAISGGRAYDDIYHMNTQSGTQWDGFRHFCHVPTKTFYNNTRSEDIMGANANDRCSIHHWSKDGAAFTGRAIFLDYRSYAESQGIKYDTATRFAISYDELVACGTYQGLDIRPQSQGGSVAVGDILLIRSGWLQDYYARTAEENSALALREGSDLAWAGVKQEPAMIDWLHDCYFSAVGGDAPSFERWPTPEKYYLHEYLLALWGVPIGEMLDLERVSELAKKHKRYTFFFTSAPANCPGGVSSHVNGTVIF